MGQCEGFLKKSKLLREFVSFEAQSTSEARDSSRKVQVVGQSLVALKQVRGGTAVLGGTVVVGGSCVRDNR